MQLIWWPHFPFDHSRVRAGSTWTGSLETRSTRARSAQCEKTGVDHVHSQAAAAVIFPL